MAKEGVNKHLYLTLLSITNGGNTSIFNTFNSFHVFFDLLVFLIGSLTMASSQESVTNHLFCIIGRFFMQLSHRRNILKPIKELSMNAQFLKVSHLGSHDATSNNKAMHIFGRKKDNTAIISMPSGVYEKKNEVPSRK
jgi:hypothetical protein